MIQDNSASQLPSNALLSKDTASVEMCRQYSISEVTFLNRSMFEVSLTGPPGGGCGIVVLYNVRPGRLCPSPPRSRYRSLLERHTCILQESRSVLLLLLLESTKSEQKEI